MAFLAHPHRVLLVVTLLIFNSAVTAGMISPGGRLLRIIEPNSTDAVEYATYALQVRNDRGDRPLLLFCGMIRASRVRTTSGEAFYLVFNAWPSEGGATGQASAIVLVTSTAKELRSFSYSATTRTLVDSKISMCP
ncbi:hypothetical protein KSP40_PGU010435 [Platanthera guangdongensis]|uniref:Uncharacterized protein n=1 Tax=Platanthera guangdongensis TaxID=2320717 RepID=A0ABR2LCK7_9ASPA